MRESLILVDGVVCGFFSALAGQRKLVHFLHTRSSKTCPTGPVLTQAPTKLPPEIRQISPLENPVQRTSLLPFGTPVGGSSGGVVAGSPPSPVSPSRTGAAKSALRKPTTTSVRTGSTGGPGGGASFDETTSIFKMDSTPGTQPTEKRHLSVCFSEASLLSSPPDTCRSECVLAVERALPAGGELPKLTDLRGLVDPDRHPALFHVIISMNRGISFARSPSHFIDMNFRFGLAHPGSESSMGGRSLHSEDGWMTPSGRPSSPKSGDTILSSTPSLPVVGPSRHPLLLTLCSQVATCVLHPCLKALSYKPLPSPPTKPPRFSRASSTGTAITVTGSSEANLVPILATISPPDSPPDSPSKRKSALKKALAAGEASASSDPTSCGSAQLAAEAAAQSEKRHHSVCFSEPSTSRSESASLPEAIPRAMPAGAELPKLNDLRELADPDRHPILFELISAPKRGISFARTASNLLDLNFRFGANGATECSSPPLSERSDDRLSSDRSPKATDGSAKVVFPLSGTPPSPPSPVPSPPHPHLPPSVIAGRGEVLRETPLLNALCVQLADPFRHVTLSSLGGSSSPVEGSSRV